jgi:hypothetical protein
MAGTTLPSYSDDTALTAAQVLAIAANINETAVAKAATENDYFVATGANAIAVRRIASNSVTSTSTTTSTSYTPSPSGDDGPEITFTSGDAAIFWYSVQQENTSGSGAVWTSFALSGATTDASSDTRAIMTNNASGVGARLGVTTYLSVTGGSNTATMEFKATSGTLSVDDRRLTAMPL